MIRNKLRVLIVAAIAIALVLGSATSVSAKAKKHTHKYIPQIVTEATCTSTGLEVYECECGDSYEREIREDAHVPIPLSEYQALEPAVEEDIDFVQLTDDFGVPIFDETGEPIMEDAPAQPVTEEEAEELEATEETDTVYVCANCGIRLNVIINGDVVISYPYDSSGSKAIVSVTNASGKTYEYRVFRQVVGFPSYSEFLASHGCSTCASTTVFTATIPKMRNYTPDMAIALAQKPVFGTKAFNKNFRKKMADQRPVTLYGITKILKKNKVKYKYVYKYKYATALTQIKQHLAEGKPVIINTRKKNEDSEKWVHSVHTMVLIGLEPDGTALILDSANHAWSGIEQRVKHCTVEEILDLDWSSKSRNKSVYYNKKMGTGGYILID